MNTITLVNDLKAEQAALGSIIFYPESVKTSLAVLKPADFYQTKHSVAFENVIRLNDQGKKVDLVTLSDELKKNNQLDTAGGYSYLTTIMNSVPAANNIEEYCKIIKEKSCSRFIQIELTKTLDMVEQGKDPKVILEHIAAIGKNTELIEEEKTLDQLFEDILVSSCEGVKYSFRIGSLNAILGGVDQSEIITIGGYTSQGKTSLALQLCSDFCEDRLKVLYCTSEMSEKETGRRLLANWQEKNLMDFRKGNFTEKEMESMQELAEMMSQTWKLTIAKVFTLSDIRNLVNKYEPQILFIDYLQNLIRKNEVNDYQKVTHDMQDIQILTRENNLTTFVLSQLSRNKENMREPRLTDLRDSGAIEEKSNIVLFVYWENRLKQTVGVRKGQEPPEELKVIVSKNRDGTIGITTLDYYPEFSKITNHDIYKQEVLA